VDKPLARVSSADGVAVARVKWMTRVQQITIEPDSGSSGTATVTCIPEFGSMYQAVKDSSGNDLSFSLTDAASYEVSGALDRIRVESSNTADSFTLIVC
jgi:hypothetical protein